MSQHTSDMPRAVTNCSQRVNKAFLPDKLVGRWPGTLIPHILVSTQVSLIPFTS